MAADEVLTISVDLDSRQAIQHMAAMQREMQKQIKKITRTVGGMGAADSKVAKQAASDSKKWSKELKGVTKYYQEEINKINELDAALKRARKARESGDEKAQKAARNRAKAIKQELKAQKKSLKKQTSVGFDTGKMGSEAKQAMGEAAKEFKGTLSSFFQKDLLGLIRGGGGIAKALTASVGKGLAAGGGVLGNKTVGIGNILGKKGAARGGVGGSAMKGVGGAMKMMGGLAKQIGPLVQTVAKVGPLVGMIGTGLMAVVKVLIDAEAQAKGFQKDLLQSASTIEVMGDSGWQTEAAFANLKDTVRGIRDAAYDAGFNLDWGTTADTHKAVWNALNQEGVSIQRIREEAKIAGQDVKQFSQGLVGVSVAYSRAFGVPLQQINQQQAELMTEMGHSASEVEMAFAQMARSAADSGIAANKFYSIIRGVSQDLSLYNVRMGETVKLLKTLGKVMNPRNAQKFMQTATRGLKDMGRTDRLRLTMLAGTGKVGSIVNRDMERKTDLLARKLKMDSKEVAKIMKSEGAKGLTTAITSKLPAEAQGAVTEMAMQLQLQMTRSKKGVFGLSGAAADVGPGAALDIKKAAVLSMTGFKSIREAVGSLGAEMMAENLGISQEELDQSAKFEMAMEMERVKMVSLLGKQKDLQEKARKDASGERKLTEKEKEDLEKLKAMTDAGITSADKVNAAGYDQLFDAMSESSKQATKDASKVVNYGKMQSSLTQSLLEKLGVLIDFVMNKIYNVMIDIYDALPSVFGGGEKRLRVEAARTKNQEVMAAADRSKGDPLKFRGEIAKAPVFQDMLKALYITPDEIAEKEARAKDLRIKKEMGKASEIEAILAADKKRMEAAKKAVDVGTKGVAPKKIDEAIAHSIGGGRLVGENWNKAMQMKSLMATGTGATEAVAKAGFAEEEQKKILSQLVHWRADPSMLAKAVGTYGEESGFTNKEMADEAKKNAESIAEEARKGAEATKEETKELTSQHTVYFKFPEAWLNGPYKKTISESVLEAIRTGLFEFYMYSALDRESVLKLMKSDNMSIQDFAMKMGETPIKEGTLPEDLFKALKTGGKDEGEEGTPAVPGKQHGGVVSRVSKEGLAIFRTPPGEGMTAIGPGERIVPAYAGGVGAGGGGGGGGGTTHVVIALAPEAQRLIQAEVRHGINEHERRKRTAG